MAGQYADDETGLFYNYYRFYDPKTGRYVTSDPLGISDGTNPYVYVHSNPLSSIDPDGQFAFLAVNPYTIGLAINTVGILTTIAIDISNDNDISKVEQKICTTNNCPPCTPYNKGSIGYQGPKTSVRGIHGTRAGTGQEHYIIFEVQQNPQNCQCRWQETKRLFGHHYLGRPLPNWIKDVRHHIHRSG